MRLTTARLGGPEGRPGSFFDTLLARRRSFAPRPLGPPSLPGGAALRFRFPPVAVRVSAFQDRREARPWYSGPSPPNARSGAFRAATGRGKTQGVLPAVFWAVRRLRAATCVLRRLWRAWRACRPGAPLAIGGPHKQRNGLPPRRRPPCTPGTTAAAAHGQRPGGGSLGAARISTARKNLGIVVSLSLVACYGVSAASAGGSRSTGRIAPSACLPHQPSRCAALPFRGAVARCRTAPSRIKLRLLLALGRVGRT
jgi:hypothetical protein